MRAAHEADIPLVIAGKCNEAAEKAYFEEQVRPLLTDNDHVFGIADAVGRRELLAGARCLLFPIEWEEPFGMVMIEAMACGTPVVALRGGAVPEIVVDSVTGMVCDRPDELPAAIHKVSTVDPATCRRHVAANFNVGQFGSGYERIYRAVVDRRVPPSGHPAMGRARSHSNATPYRRDERAVHRMTMPPTAANPCQSCAERSTGERGRNTDVRYREDPSMSGVNKTKLRNLPVKSGEQAADRGR